MSSNTSFSAAQVASVSTSTMSSTSFRAMRNVSLPTCFTATPSANSPTCGSVTRRPGRDRARHRVRLDRLHADDLHFGAHALDVRRDARDQAAAADRDEDRVERSLPLAQDLHADRALPGDDVRVVVRMNERGARLLLQLAAPSRRRPSTSRRAARPSRRAPSTAATLMCGVVTGMTIVAWQPRRCAASATPCAWLPADAAITPRARSAADRCAILLYAPRSLNENTLCWSSRFSSTRLRAARTASARVRAATRWRRRRPSRSGSSAGSRSAWRGIVTAGLADRGSRERRARCATAPRVGPCRRVA